MAEHPKYPFNFALSIAPYIKQRMVTINEIPDGMREVNRAGFPELIRWLCACIRPVDKVEFIKALENNVFFRSKKDFVLTEKNHRDFYENIKMYNRDFCCLLDLLMDSLQEGQEAPPMTVKEGVGILSVYIKKIPCDYGWAVWTDMPTEKKYKKFSEFLTEFMKVCQRHRNLSEGTQKLSHVVSYRKDKGNYRKFNSDIRPFENGNPKGPNDHRPRYSDNRQNGHNMSMMESRRNPAGQDEDFSKGYYEEEYLQEEFPPLDEYEYAPEEYPDYDQEGANTLEMEGKKHSERDNLPESPEESSRLNAFMQGPNRFGPKPSFPSNRPPPALNSGRVPARPPPPVPGVCFEILKTGTCEAQKMGRCTYDHSAAAFSAYMKKKQENIDAYLSHNGGSSKPRA